MSPSRVGLPHRIRPGTIPKARPGDRLRCLVLCSVFEEWFGVDLGSGAFVRVPGGHPSPLEDDTLSLPAVEFVVAERRESLDPARPELVEPASDPKPIGRPRARPVRRLLGRLASPDVEGATILATRGPSIAFIDLDGTAPSLQLLEIPAKRLELGVNERSQPALAIPWGGTTVRIRIADPRAIHAATASAPRPLRGQQITAALGYRPAFVLVGLGPVTDGHVPKLVLALL